ncbi:MAG: DUF3108 domain-containing protein [bacterium]
MSHCTGHFVLFVAVASFALAGRVAGADTTTMLALDDPRFAVPEYERLRFSIEFGVIKAGTATMESHQHRGASGESLVVFTSRARSSSFFTRFYPVDDVVTSTVEARSLLPIRFEKRLSEGNYRANEAMTFDRAANRVTYANGETVSAPDFARDVLSAFYDVRRHLLVPGSSFGFVNHANKKTSLIEVKVIGREVLDTRIGRFHCIKVQPVLARGGLFKNEGRIWVWFTDDAMRIPVKMESKLAFGAITAEIEKVERPELRLDAKTQKRARR